MPLFKHLILISIVVTSPVAAQDEPIVLETPERESFDYRLFRNVYEYQEPVFSAAMRGVNVASYPAFFVVIPAAGITDYVVDGELGIASRFAVAELATFGVVYGLKHIVRRARPYAVLPDVRRRPLGDDQPPGGIDPFSFPSGHSAVAFSIATVASLSHPDWYVIAPMMTWASATALARVWHGV
ncbi:MAG: phosphatase PAP2 family protein, partial [Rubricoccaceae bacterium]|nr:phosphatase PAP2 family protein [Rubricoccaceae bacterium]